MALTEQAFGPHYHRQQYREKRGASSLSETATVFNITLKYE